MVFPDLDGSGLNRRRHAVNTLLRQEHRCEKTYAQEEPDAKQPQVTQTSKHVASYRVAKLFPVSDIFSRPTKNVSASAIKSQPLTHLNVVDFVCASMRGTAVGSLLRRARQNQSADGTQDQGAGSVEPHSARHEGIG